VFFSGVKEMAEHWTATIMVLFAVHFCYFLYTVVDCCSSSLAHKHFMTDLSGCPHYVQYKHTLELMPQFKNFAASNASIEDLKCKESQRCKGIEN
jgi:hypothetical protein